MKFIKYVKLKLTMPMIIPAILNRILGVVSKRYLKSTPFQKAMRYFMTCSIFPPSNLQINKKLITRNKRKCHFSVEADLGIIILRTYICCNRPLL